MENNNKLNGMNRRKFIQNTALFTTSTLFLGLGDSNVFGANTINSNIDSIKNVILNNGVKMPILGFGTLTLKGSVGEQCIADAISLGYRLLDTATIYGNEETVGAGIKLSGIKREELFVTSKLWVDDSGYEKTKLAFETTLKRLGLNYLDLYLIHRPRGDVKGSWKAMEELYKEGKIRAIGVSNFEPQQLDDLIANHTVIPAVNQIESHAYFNQSEAHEFLQTNRVQMEAWAPFAEGRNALFTNPTLAEIGKKHNKTNAQISLRWLYQRGIVAIPRTSKKEHMIENLSIFDFELDKNDMNTISTLNLNKTQFPDWN
jgi:2,5-diketo-D-gluconate reductase A